MRSQPGTRTDPVGGEMSLATLLLGLGLLIQPGNGNEGSRAGSCPCNRLFHTNSPPTAQELEHFRKQLRTYDNCVHYIRFQLRLRNVCGGIKDSWVLELMRCFKEKECGRAYSGTMTQQQQHIPPHSTQVSVSPESAPLNISTAAWMYQPSSPLPSTQLSMFVAETSSLDRKFTCASGFTTSNMSHSLDATADHLKHQEEENLDPVAGPPVLVPVLSLLAIIFILISILLYVVLKKRQKSRQHFQDLQLDYTSVAQDLV